MSIKDALDAEREAAKQRLAAAARLVVDEAKAAPEDAALIARVRTASRAGSEQWDKALADAGVNALFARGVLNFRSPT